MADAQCQLQPDGTRVCLSGDLILAHTSRLLREGKAAIESGARSIDLGGAQQLDSSALSLLLGLQRHAQVSGVSLSLIAVPESLQSLARLYGVAELI